MSEQSSPYVVYTTACLFFLCCLLLPLTAAAQVRPAYDEQTLQNINDTVERYMQRHPRKFAPKENRPRVYPLYGLNYSAERQLEARGGMTLLYRNGLSKKSKPSTFILYGHVSTNLCFGFRASGLNNGAKGRLGLLYDAGYSRLNRYFWGIGLDNNRKDTNRSRYIEEKFNCSGEFLFSLGKKVSLGPVIGFDYFNTFDYSNPDLVAGQPLHARSFNLGLRFRLDTRDDGISPRKGIYVSFRQQCYPGFIFNQQPFYKSAITADFFTGAWKGAVLAFDLFGEFNYGEAPWLFWGDIGGAERMRGYYEGRYKERNIAFAQLEIRQQIYRMHGIVVWGGAGNLFRTFSDFDIKETLPTYGAGYRLSLAGLVFRFDVGFGNRGQYAFIAGINHSF